jgi:hypothetical protein
MSVSKIVLKSIYCLVFIALITFHNKPVFAAPKDTITAIPSIEQLDLQKDKSQYDLTYENTTSQPIELSFSARDFSDFDDGWKVSFLSQTDASNYHYSLSSWIHFSTQDLVVNPNDSKKITIYIDNNRISPGSHYAAILASLNDIDRSKTIGVHGVLSSLLFVTTSTGLEVEDAKIIAFQPIRYFFEIPEKYIFRFQNQGNVDSTPYGLIDVYSPFGKLLSETVVNDGSLITLPESIRRYDLLIPKPSGFLFPGTYKATLTLHYGKTNKKLYTEIYFFSQGSIDIFITASLLIILIIAFYYLRKTGKLKALYEKMK